MDIKHVNHAFGSNARSDRAIIAMALLRVWRKPGEKGVGPNRDDAPIFKLFADKCAAGQDVDRETTFMARFRVQKYARQVRGSRYNTLVDDETGFCALVEQYRQGVTERMSQDILNAELQREQGYGDW